MIRASPLFCILALLLVPIAAASPNLLSANYYNPGASAFQNDPPGGSGDAKIVCFSACSSSVAGTITNYYCANSVDDSDATGCDLGLSADMLAAQPCLAVWDTSPTLYSGLASFVATYYIDFDGVNFGPGKEAQWVKLDVTLASNSTQDLSELCFAFDAYDASLSPVHGTPVTGFSAGHNQFIVPFPHGNYVAAAWRIYYNSQAPTSPGFGSLKLNTVGLYLDNPSGPPAPINNDPTGLIATLQVVTMGVGFIAFLVIYFNRMRTE